MSTAAALECMLFVAAEPLTFAEMARGLACDQIAAEEALRVLQIRLGETGSGLQVVPIAGGYQLATRPEHAECVGRMLQRATGRLSRAALETLAVIAYRQPVTAPEVEAVRGVTCTGVLKTLVERRLVAEVGRKQTVGRPILYGTTAEFLHYFALSDLSELPPLADGEPPAAAGPAPDAQTAL